MAESSATIPGGESAHALRYGQQAYASGKFAARGDAQTSLYVLRNSTSTTNLTELFMDGAYWHMTIPVGGTWTFEIQVTGRNNSGSSAGYLFSGVVKNVGGTTSIVGGAGAVNKTVLAEDVGAWDASVSAVDGSTDALVIQVTGDTSTIRWVGSARLTEVQY